MHELVLEWTEAGQRQQQTIREAQPGFPNKIYLGRDPARCQVVLQHPTVSGLHIAIWFDAHQQQFYLENLRESNPPVVDGQRVATGAVPLQVGSRILLGSLELQVVLITVTPAPIPCTVLLEPEEDPEPTYGLRCSHCQKVSPYDRLDLGCPWCGASLATAASVLIPPDSTP